ncbi:MULTISPECIES: 50S ribosomal protein L35 [unclassified Nitratiruptor]|uniref:50S ribosomal protein L35 n=1 Tax=unclassified Nitratiruptor TaxID=2624044 RepID=UPI0019169F5B|nr:MULTISPECIES: 50S ribosomal protein L35 [unclassified Nitratiruptor]
MPKMKTHRGAAKRFKKTKNKIKRGSAFRSHILTKKSQKTKRHLRAPHYVSKVDEPRVIELISTY